ncbi:MAG: hypothetical protein JOZ67_03355, partial [Gammaproteobacteria bacterium]|nr:hypothetical protein [Gammaproteobacteria bacterium]
MLNSVIGRAGASAALAACGLMANSMPAHATAGTCLATYSKPKLVNLSGSLTQVVIDDLCEFAYVANTGSSSVEVVSLATGVRGTPILVGSQPTGIDLSPDGATLYV